MRATKTGAEGIWVGDDQLLGRCPMRLRIHRDPYLQALHKAITNLKKSKCHSLPIAVISHHGALEDDRRFLLKGQYGRTFFDQRGFSFAKKLSRHYNAGARIAVGALGIQEP